jgi:hypothetical protein
MRCVSVMRSPYFRLLLLLLLKYMFITVLVKSFLSLCFLSVNETKHYHYYINGGPVSFFR